MTARKPTRRRKKVEEPADPPVVTVHDRDPLGGHDVVPAPERPDEADE
jgi:hypothetical protein